MKLLARGGTEVRKRLLAVLTLRAVVLYLN